MPTLEASTWYQFTSRCATPECSAYQQVFDTEGDSNVDGDPRIICGRCGGRNEILTAVLLDPQPVAE